MKITQLAIVLLFGMGFMSCQNSNTVSIETKTDSVSYVLGAFQGQSMIENFKKAQIDSMIDMDLYFEAFKNAAQGKTLKMDPDSNNKVITTFFQTLQTSNMMAARDTTGMTAKFQPSQSILDSISYLLGADFGKRLTDDFARNGLDTVLSVPIIAKSFVASLSNEDLLLDPKANMPMVDAFFKNWQEEQMKVQEEKMREENADVIRAGEEFLAKNKALDEITETASGLQYEIIKEGKGPKPTFSNTVKVHYHGTFVDGSVFDSSVDRGEPATFGVGQVIKGWTEALQLMPVGSKWKLYIPYQLAYGPQGRGSIPPFSMLIFEVELLEIVK